MLKLSLLLGFQLQNLVQYQQFKYKTFPGMELYVLESFHERNKYTIHIESIPKMCNSIQYFHE